MSNTASPTSQAIAANLAGVMDRSGMSVEEVADSAGTYRMVLRRRLTGRSAINMDEVAALAGCSVSDRGIRCWWTRRERADTGRAGLRARGLCLARGSRRRA